MQVATGTTAPLRDVLRTTANRTLLPAIASATTRITDVGKAIFIELRERGAESCVARVVIDLSKTDHRRRRHGYLFGTFDNSVSVHTNIPPDTFVEIYTDKSGRLSVKPSKLLNISTPYIFGYGNDIGSNELFFSTQRHAIISTIHLRREFTRDVYRIATETDEATYKVCALKAMEQYLVTLISAEKIDLALAEKKYALYDKVQERIWRGSTPGEQIAAFRRAWEILANITDIRGEGNGHSDSN